MLFSRTNPRSKKRGRAAQPSKTGSGVERDAKSSASRGSRGSSGSNKSSPLTLSLPPNIKRHSSGDSSSCSSTASLSSRTASTATASTVTENTKNIAANAGAMALDIPANQRKREGNNTKNRQAKSGLKSTGSTSNKGPALTLDHYLALNNSQTHDLPSPLSSPSPSYSLHSQSSDESHDSSISSWQRHQPVSTSHASNANSVRGDPISRLENEVTKLSAALKKYKKYTPEWFVLDTKLSAAKEELDAVREDRDLDFLDMDDPTQDSEVGIPETVLVRSEELEEQMQKERVAESNDASRETTPVAKLSARQQEYQEAVQKLNKVDKFSDEWFLLQEQVIELRTKVMEEAVTNATQPSESYKEMDSSIADTEQEDTSAYLVPLPIARALSDTRPKQSLNVYPAPYHERSSSLPSDASLFGPNRRSMSPPILMRYSPPSSPLVSRNLFPSSASINSSLYSQTDDDEGDEGSRLFSSIPHEDDQLAKLRGEHSEACLKLDTLPQFSKKWFDLKTKIVQLEEQIENLDNGSVGGLSHFSYGGVADKSSSAWSEEDDEIMSFASDLELCMIGEALKQGNCMISSFDDAELISPIGDDDYCDEGDLLVLEHCELPDFAMVESDERQKNVCAALIQNHWRKHKVSNVCWSSAIKIQSFVRCKIQLSHYKEHKRQYISQVAAKYQRVMHSAVCIQTAWRKAHQRREEYKARTVLASSQSSECAVRIQSTLRGSNQRKKYARIRNAVLCIQSFSRMKQQQKMLRKSANAILIQRVTRRWIVQKYLHEDEVAVSRSILQDQDSVHSKSILGESSIQNSPSSRSKSSPARPSIEVIQRHHRALSLRRNQVLKFSDEWFYTTELIQGLEHELGIREREQVQDASDEILSLEDSRHDDELSGSIPSMREDSSPSQVMRIVHTTEAQTSSHQSSPRGSLSSSGWTNFSSNEFTSASPTSGNSAEEENLKCLGKECLRLTRELEGLPRFSDEWFQCKVELKSVTEELEFLYSHRQANKR